MKNKFMKTLFAIMITTLTAHPLLANQTELTESEKACQANYESIVKNSSALLPVINKFKVTNSTWAPLSKDAYEWYGETIPVMATIRLIKKAIDSNDDIKISNTYDRSESVANLLDNGISQGKYVAEVASLGSELPPI